VDRLGRDEIVRALGALGAELGAASPPVSLVVVGGAALVLLYAARETTKDVDAFTTTPTDAARVRDASARVATRLSLPPDWLNDAAKGFVQGLAFGETVLTTPGLVVRTLAPHQLLAMKLSAWRDDVDIEDARLLLSKLGDDRERAWRMIAPHLVPGRELKAQYAFEDLWSGRDAS
jgi:hypothetical protein